MLLVHLFVSFVRVSFCHFSLPLGVRSWLRFVIVARLGLFYYLSQSLKATMYIETEEKKN